MDTITASAEFCRLMIVAEADRDGSNPKSCVKVNKQINFLENGGSMVDYESSKIRGEIQDVFHSRLKALSSRLDC